MTMRISPLGKWGLLLVLILQGDRNPLIYHPCTDLSTGRECVLLVQLAYQSTCYWPHIAMFLYDFVLLPFLVQRTQQVQMSLLHPQEVSQQAPTTEQNQGISWWQTA